MRPVKRHLYLVEPDPPADWKQWVSERAEQHGSHSPKPLTDDDLRQIGSILGVPVWPRQLNNREAA